MSGPDYSRTELPDYHRFQNLLHVPFVLRLACGSCQLDNLPRPLNRTPLRKKAATPEIAVRPYDFLCFGYGKHLFSELLCLWTYEKIPNYSGYIDGIDYLYGVPASPQTA